MNKHVIGAGVAATFFFLSPLSFPQNLGELFKRVSLETTAAHAGGPKTRIEIQAGPGGATVRRTDPDGYREQTDFYVNPYTGQPESYTREGYGRNPKLRDGSAPDVLTPRYNRYGDPMCPEGYNLRTDIMGRTDCVLRSYYPRYGR